MRKLFATVVAGLGFAVVAVASSVAGSPVLAGIVATALD
jgi:hypothetical protein